MEENRNCRSIQNNLMFRKIIFFLIGLFEIIFTFRLISKLIGANPGSNLISLIYRISGILLDPFSGASRITGNKGLETNSIFETTTIIAMITYATIAYGVIMLFESYEIPKDRGTG